MGALSDIVSRNGPFQGKKLYGLCKGILNGLEYIHSQRFAHLDLKPANILIDRHGRPRLADFGVARLFRARNISEQRAGTLVFMAPEILSGRGYDPFKADMWSLGVTFYFLATGTLPWVAEAFEQCKEEIQSGNIRYPDELDPAFRSVLQAVLNINPAQRSLTTDLLKMDVFQKVDAKEGFILDKGQRASRAPAAATRNTIGLTSRPRNVGITSGRRPMARGGTEAFTEELEKEQAKDSGRSDATNPIVC
jgi:serine/threonine protein kinase